MSKIRNTFLIILFISGLFILPLSRVSAIEPIKILIVPGHDSDIWGAQYGNIKEADMNFRLATELYKILNADKRFQVYMTRDTLGYTTTFSDYFSLHQAEIEKFKEDAKQKTAEKINRGELVVTDGAPHNNAPALSALLLYSFNKWAGENDIDAVIHVHFNDYPRENNWVMGIHKGFVIYTPEKQMANGEASLSLAQSIFKELKKKYITSTYPPEEGGLVEDQKLIALGTNGTLPATVRSILIEYGYIYRFSNSIFRHKSYQDMAARTATGIKNYFFPI